MRIGNALGFLAAATSDRATLSPRNKQHFVRMFTETQHNMLTVELFIGAVRADESRVSNGFPSVASGDSELVVVSEACTGALSNSSRSAVTQLLRVRLRSTSSRKTRVPCVAPKRGDPRSSRHALPVGRPGLHASCLLRAGCSRFGRGAATP